MRLVEHICTYIAYISITRTYAYVNKIVYTKIICVRAYVKNMEHVSRMLNDLREVKHHERTKQSFLFRYM
jgi:hypothetical protein